MKKVGTNEITAKELTYMLISSMIGVGVIGLPNVVIQDAKQDGWISAALGAVYPLYIIFMAILIYRKFPKDNILVLSRRYYGRILGSIFNIIFLCFFMVYLTSDISGLNNILKNYIVVFLEPYKIILVLTFLGAYTAYKGLKVLGRAGEGIFILICILSLIPFAAITKGSIINIKPVFGSGLLNIIKESKDSAFSYGGAEIIFLIYPYLAEPEKFKGSVLKSVAFVTWIYTFFVFITIYYVGIGYIPKGLWSFLSVTKILEIPVINSFRFIFMILWSIIIFKTISNFYFASAYIFKDLIKKVSMKKIIASMYPIVVCLSMLYSIEPKRRAFLDFIVPKLTIFNLIFVTVLVLIIYLKKGEIDEKK